MARGRILAKFGRLTFLTPLFLLHRPKYVGIAFMDKHISKYAETRHLPKDVVHYREYKILLKPDRFVTKEGFIDFWEAVGKTLKRLGLKVDLDHNASDSQIREVLFYDTPEFHLYNNHFILRKRTYFEQGWPRQDHELVLKYRDPDLAKAAGVDVRPELGGHDEIKFKEELLLDRERLGGIRSVYSHGCVLTSPKIVLDQGVENITRAFPCLRSIDISPATRMELVNNVAVEEVQNTFGIIHFHHHFKGKATVAVWRSRAMEKSLAGEFAFQCKFEELDEVPGSAVDLSEEFYKQVQLDCSEWVKLGTTKTAMVYGMGTTKVINSE
jgi:hypothetical protein